MTMTDGQHLLGKNKEIYMSTPIKKWAMIVTDGPNKKVKNVAIASAEEAENTLKKFCETIDDVTNKACSIGDIYNPSTKQFSKPS